MRIVLKTKHGTIKKRQWIRDITEKHKITEFIIIECYIFLFMLDCLLRI